MAAVTSCKNTLYLLKNLTLMSRCGPSLVQLSYCLYLTNLRKGTIEKNKKKKEKNYTNVHTNDISKVLLMIIDLMPTISFRIRAVATIFERI